MGKIHTNIMSTFRYLIFLLVFFVANIFSASASECIIANDMGGSYRTVVKANPSGLRDDAGYRQDSSTYTGESRSSDISPSQRAEWVDSKVFTNGNPFYFEIEGSWTPWYGNAKELVDKYGHTVTIRANKNQLCVLKTVNYESPNMGVGGEFYYINSAYEVNENGSGYTKIYLDP